MLAPGAALFALLGLSAAVGPPSPDGARRPDVSDLAGTWRVDLRPAPEAEPDLRTMVISVDDGQVAGTFYDTPFRDFSANADRGMLRFAFVTEDRSGLYHTTGRLVEGRLEGTTHAVGREFLAVWTAERTPAFAGRRTLNCHDGADAPPRLRVFLNLWGLSAYPSAGEEWSEEEKVRRLAAAGFDGFDVWIGGATNEDIERWRTLARAHDLEVGVEFGPATMEDVAAALAAARRLGAVYLDAHVGSYFTPPNEAEALLRGLVTRCRTAGVPLVIQTHRGRVTQDLLRTVRYARTIPDLRFDLDLSHYFVAGEITGPTGPEAEAALAVLMDRAIMLDGRISNGQQVQVDLTSPAHREATERTALLWKKVMTRWLGTARRGDVFPFRVELGPPGYAIVDSEGRELSDRFEQQLRMRDLVVELWNEAVAGTGRGEPHRPPP